MKIIKSIYADIIENMDGISHVINGLAGNCSNLYANYLNDYSSHGINYDVAQFLCEHCTKLSIEDVQFILENPDYIIQRASEEFQDALATAMHSKDNGTGYMDARDNAETIIKQCKAWFDAWGNFYVFAEPWSNACTRYYIIRADSFESAYEELATRFESDFAVDNVDVTDETETNDNGNPVNLENVQLAVEFKIEKE